MRTYSNVITPIFLVTSTVIPYRIPRGAVVVIPTFQMENPRAEMKAFAEAPQSPGALASGHQRLPWCCASVTGSGPFPLCTAPPSYPAHLCTEASAYIHWRARLDLHLILKRQGSKNRITPGHVPQGLVHCSQRSRGAWWEEHPHILPIPPHTPAGGRLLRHS